MLDEFKNSQFVSYSLLVNAIRNNKLSHAYLIDANGYDKSFDFVMAFVKAILCGGCSNFAELSDEEVNLCRRIDNNNFPEIKVIESDTAIIKKEQLLELQSDFSLSSIEGNYRIYIIKDCDKMNKQAANCLLKFLEEPTSGVIAILITNKFNKLLSTIISRCQVIRLNNIITFSDKSTLENFALITSDNKEEFDSFVGDSSFKKLIDDVICFIDYFEENGLDTLIYMKDKWHTKFSTREEVRLAFLLMIYFYYDVFKYKIGNDSKCFFCDRVDFVKKCANINSVSSILKKLDVVNYGYEMVNYNLNLNLLLDDVVIRLGDNCEYC